MNTSVMVFEKFICFSYEVVNPNSFFVNLQAQPFEKEIRHELEHFDGSITVKKSFYKVKFYTVLCD